MAKPRRSTWRQISGDMNPGAYGATIARFDGDAVEIREIQPVRNCVGDREALEVGFPFWSREAYYSPEDLELGHSEVIAAMRSRDLAPEDLESLSYDEQLLAIAECCLSYGHLADEGPCGWAADVCPQRVYWWGDRKRPHGPSYISDEDAELKGLQMEAKESE